MNDRKLEWRPVDTAPLGQDVLMWNAKNGTWGRGRILDEGQGGYVVTGDVPGATHYALVEGPSI